VSIVKKTDLLSKLGKTWFTFFSVIKLLWKIEPRILFMALVGFTLLGIIFAPLSYLNKLIIDSIVANINNSQTGNIINVLVILILTRVLLEIFRETIQQFTSYWRYYLYGIFDAHFIYLITEKRSQLDSQTIEDPEFKDRYNKLERTVSTRTWDLMYVFLTLPMNLSGLLAAMIILISFKPILILFILILVVPQFLIERGYIKKIYEVENVVSRKNRILNTYLSPFSSPRSYMEAKILNIAPYFLAKIAGLKKEIYEMESDAYFRRKIVAYLFSLPQNFFYFGLEVYLVIETLFQRLTVGSLQFYVSATSSFRYSLSAFFQSINELYEHYTYVKEIIWLMELKPNIVSGNISFPEKVQTIEFKNVWFKYKEDQDWTLRGINLLINEEEDIAIVGENGAGKSTLIKLLCRFYDPQKGEILINGINLKEIKRNSLWKHLGVLFQMFETFPLKASTSIGYGDIKNLENKEKIIEAAKKSSIHEYVESLPLGYENPLQADFEKGTDPSVGQWQRIGLARVFMRNPSIMILDEPTSNVDPKSEEEIFQKVLEEGKKKNLILISHRFSTVRKANKIAVMDRGKIVEYGTHEELMKKNGMYAELFNLQAKSYQ
jgi:ABC-type multidrug transport system fused ATPase/permease subunit